MVVVALLSVDLVESVDLVSVELVVNCILKLYSVFRKYNKKYELVVTPVVSLGLFHY